MSFDSGLDIKQRTPMQKLIEWVKKEVSTGHTYQGGYIDPNQLIRKAESLLLEERQVIEDSHKQGQEDGHYNQMTSFKSEKTAEQYFNQKFGSNDKE